MSRTRMSAKEVRKTARDLEKSLEFTHQGLNTLLNSLEHSGFRDAVPAYQQLQLVLIQQRLWSRTYQRDELTPLWRKIAKSAEAIHVILAPFAAIMESLKGIDRIETVDQAESSETKTTASIRREDGQPNNDATDELADLILDRLSISSVKLSRKLTWSQEDRQARLKELTAAGIIERRGWGRGQSYQLTPKVRQQLSAELTRVLQTKLS